MSNFQSPTLPAVNVNQQNPLKMKTRAINLNSFEKLCYILASSPTLKRSQERKGAARGSNQMPRPTGKNACNSHSYNNQESFRRWFVEVTSKPYSKPDNSPGFLGCKTRGSNFWSMQKFVPKLQKLWYLLHWLDQLFLGKSKIFLQKTYSVGSPAIAIKMQKNYPIMQKFLHADSKTTFCSVENPG